MEAARAAAIDPLDELYFRKPIRQHVAEFGALFALIALMIAGSQAWKGHFANSAALVAVAGVFTLFGYKFPRVLKPVWESWMKLAHGLGLVMTTIILSIGWGLVMIPFALALKVLRTKVMDLRYGVDVATYWDDVDPKHNDFKMLERQY